MKYGSLNVGYLLGVILFYVAWPFGIWHAFSEHGFGHGVSGVLIPPYSWYLATEYFWHKDGQAVKVDGDEGTVKHFVEKCQKNEKEFGRSGLDRIEYNLFCSCYWTKIVSSYPEGETEYFDAHGRNSPALEKAAKSIIIGCKSIAKH